MRDCRVWGVLTKNDAKGHFKNLISAGTTAHAIVPAFLS